MYRMRIGILSVALLGGCGVGVEEASDGQGLMTSTQAGLVVGESGTQSQWPAITVTTAPAPATPGGNVGLPQDPIPVFEARPPPPPDPKPGNLRSGH